jgi:hypothetical protein
MSIVSANNKGCYMKSRAGAEGIQDGTPNWLLFYQTSMKDGQGVYTIWNSDEVAFLLQWQAL